MTEVPVVDRLSVLRQTHADYQRLVQSEDGWPDLELVAVKIEIETVPLDESGFNSVCDAIFQKNRQGWAEFRSELAWSGSASQPEFETAGQPLMAEWTDGARASVRLRAESSGSPTARTWRISERSLGQNDPLTEGETAHLRETTERMAHAQMAPVAALEYHIYWGAGPGDSPYALRRLFDRFGGFKKQGPL